MRIFTLRHALSALAATCLLGATTAASAAAPVWKVSKGDQHVYIGGTVHVLSRKDYPLPSAFYEAWSDSSEVVFETDIAGAAAPEFGQKFMMAFANPPGVTAESQVSQEVWQRMLAFGEERGVPLEGFQPFHPAFSVLVLTVVEMQRLGFSEEEGVDIYFQRQAVATDRPVGQLETLDEQLSYLESFKLVEPDLLVTATLEEIGSTENMMEGLLAAWRSGDMEELWQIGAASMGDIPEVYEVLISQRNARWLPQVEAMLKTEPVEFVLVGGLHLAGPTSLLTMLEKKGYSITQLN